MPELLERSVVSAPAPARPISIRTIPADKHMALPNLEWRFSEKHSWPCAILSIFLHAGVVYGIGMGALHQVEYGISAADGGAIEIQMADIVAPVPEKVTPKQTVPVPPPPDREAVPTPDAKPVEEAPAQQSATAASEASAQPQSATPGQGQTLIKPGYMHNPPPPYPVEARRLKQEGVVLLDVSITRDGTVSDLQLKSSSGYALLDEAAMTAVRRWRFKAPRIAGIALATRLNVPIRFQLKKT